METNDGKWEKLKFGGKAVKVFLFVFINVAKDGMFELDDIIDGEEVVEGKIGARFARTIGGNSVIKDIFGFHGGGEVSVDY